MYFCMLWGLSDSWKFSTCTGRFMYFQYILTPSIFNIMDMPLLYSISSLKSMTDMRQASDFRLGGGGGWAGQNLTEKGFVNFLVLKLVYGGFNVLNLLTEGSTVTFKENCTFWFKRGTNISRGGGRTQLLIPLRTCDCQGESGPSPPPPE